MKALALVKKVRGLQAMQAARRKRATERGSRTKKLISLDTFLRTKAPTYEAFCEQLKITSKDGKRVPFRFNECQRRYNAARTKRDVALKARQQGFTTEGVHRDVWYFLTHRNDNVLVICQSINLSAALKDVTDSVRSVFRSLREDAGVDLRFRTETNTDWAIEGRRGTLRCIEAGASKAAASKKGRAGRIARLHITEIAFWEFAGETLNALLECVPPLGIAPDTEIEIESTPNGAAPDVKREERDIKGATGASTFHWRYQDARAGLSEYKAHFFPWWATEEYRSAILDGEVVAPADEEERFLERQGVTAEQRKWRRAKVIEKGADLFDQEFPKDDLTCFLLSGRTFFDKARTNLLILGIRDPIEKLPIRTDGAQGELRIYHRAERGREYVLSADPSEGTGGDPCAGHVYERGTGRLMAVIDGQIRPWEFGRALAGIGERYDWATIAVERINHGHAVLQALAQQKYPEVFEDEDGQRGWVNTHASRSAALDRLEEVMRAEQWVPRDRAILGDVRTFVVDLKGHAAAAKGAHDDHVLAGAIGWNVLTRPRPRREMGQRPIGLL